jgi:TRAP-type C4-dicarboxylate transport system substrate-binding protein
MSEWYAGYVTNTHPMLAAPELPYLLPKFVPTREAIDAFKRAWSAPLAKAALEGVMEKFKIRIAARTYLEPIHMWTTAAVEKPYAIGGLKMRANTPENGLMINAIGGTAHFMPVTDVYPAAQRNVISGLFTSVNAVLSLKLDEVTKHGTVNNSQLVSGGYLVSKASHGKLPADLKKIFDEEMAAVDAHLFELVSKTDAQGMEQIAAKGVTLRKVTDEEYAQLRKIAQEKVWPEWKKKAGPDADKVLAEILKAIETK